MGIALIVIFVKNNESFLVKKSQFEIKLFILDSV